MTDSAVDRARRLRRFGWWLGVAPAALCALLAAALLALPLMERLPQQDRPYGWLLDPLAMLGGYSLAAIAAIFGAFAFALFAKARRAERSDAGERPSG
ncbi:MAG: hypothetical protein E6Q50_07435 [Lysobacter sp.]|nr:MAG: hypothetical protein E6Q50_07435 [Lysobacter sp.]